MMLSDLDGYVAGLIVSPEPILPAEWLPAVWAGDADGAPFDDARDMDWFVDQIMQHHDATTRTLDRRRGSFAPFLEEDPRNGDTLWELWIEGFEQAMALRPDSWDRIAASGDEPAVEALAGIATLVAIARDESDLDRAAIDALTQEAPDLIPAWIERLYAWRQAHAPAAPALRAAPAPAKTGRNDACPCGSGRKFKKCCGAG